MTRINLIPPEQLYYKHLIAEYRELPRIFTLARPNSNAPLTYVLGTGHMKFFFDKLKFLHDRYCTLYNEMLNRKYNLSLHPDVLAYYEVEKPKLWNDWEPTIMESINAKEINIQRLRESLHRIDPSLLNHYYN